MIKGLKIFVVTVLLGSIALMGASVLRPDQDQSWNVEDVNLALRQVAHTLYLYCDDDTSSIEPVQQWNENTFAVKMNHGLHYDQLPEVLEQAIIDFDLPKEYNVAIKDCEGKAIVLGYNFKAVKRNEIACMGRDYGMDCIYIQLSFTDTQKSTSLISYLLIILFFGGMVGLLLYSLLMKRSNKSDPQMETEADDTLKLGQFRFDPTNQFLLVDNDKVTLTFREAKLLHYLASNPNQVLSRDQILANVWEDEGVIVGRSLDVFISRLRKILKSDPSIQIKSVHGIGYRLEN